MRGRKAVIPFLISLSVVGKAAASLVSVAVGILLILSGYLLGMEKAEDCQKLIEEYEAQLTANTIINDINTRRYLSEIYVRDQSFAMTAHDFSVYGKNYAWSLAKYTALKALFNNSNVSDAQQAARDAVYDYYFNLTKSLIAMNNETVELLNYSINYYVDNIQINKIRISGYGTAYYDAYSQTVGGVVTCSVTGDWFTEFDNVTMSWTGTERVDTNNPDGVEYQLKANGIGGIGAESVSMLGQNFALKTLTITIDYSGGTTGTSYVNADNVVIAGEEVYNITEILNALGAIDEAYNQIIANIDVYISEVASNYTTLGINETDLIDPYLLASMMNSDFNNTGYYGYAAAELALLGLPLTSLNYTVCIEVNNTTLCGILFSDYEGNLTLNYIYTADPNYLWYFIDEDGHLHNLQGYNITIVDLRDKNGNQIDSITLVKYVDHSGDIQKLYEEIQKLNELYNEYLEMQVFGGGGVSGGFFDWFNNLSDIEKIAIIGIGVIVLLIARK